MGPKIFSQGRYPWTSKGLSMSAPTWAYRPKPPLHGLSLSKSPIKNHAILFGSGQVVKPNQTKLGSTKPNRFYHYQNNTTFCTFWTYFDDSSPWKNTSYIWHIFPLSYMKIDSTHRAGSTTLGALSENFKWSLFYI